MHAMQTAAGGWTLDPFTYAAAVAGWVAVVVLHGLWRSAARPDPDRIRPSGPIDL